MKKKAECLSIPVDLIRTFAIVLVIVLHAATEPVTINDENSPETVTLQVTRDIYSSLARPAVPLFVMLSGALLLQPSKLKESLRVFFKKRIIRIGLPFLFWGIAYFAWRVFVHGEVLSTKVITQGALTGPYFHFWFFYALIGLYLVTPVLRVLVAYLERSTFKFFIILWFLGTSIVPLIGLIDGYQLNSNLFVATGWVGYFLLGAYTLKTRMNPKILWSLLVAGLTYTILGTYFVTTTLGEAYCHFFFEAYSFNIIGITVALFLLLCTIQPKTLEKRIPKGNRVLQLISQNTIFLYMFHVMVLEAFQKGFFGFKISLTTVNPILEVPLITAVTLLICLAIIYPLQKIPIIKGLIGSARVFDKN